MDLAAISDLVGIITPSGMVAVGIWFFISRAYPDLMERDAEERQRQHERECERDSAQMRMANSLESIAKSQKER